MESDSQVRLCACSKDREMLLLVILSSFWRCLAITVVDQLKDALEARMVCYSFVCFVKDTMLLVRQEACLTFLFGLSISNCHWPGGLCCLCKSNCGLDNFTLYSGCRMPVYMEI